MVMRPSGYLKSPHLALGAKMSLRPFC